MPRRETREPSPRDSEPANTVVDRLSAAQSTGRYSLEGMPRGVADMTNVFGESARNANRRTVEISPPVLAKNRERA